MILALMPPKKKLRSSLQNMVCGHTEDLHGHTEGLCGHTEGPYGPTEGLCDHTVGQFGHTEGPYGH